MKIRTITRIYFLIISFLCSAIAANAQTTVYFNDFNVAENPLTTNNPGTPEVTWSVTTTSTGLARTAQLGSTGNYLLQIRNDAKTPLVAGRTYVSGELSKYSSPFNNTLNSNSSDIIWTFNIRSGRNSSSTGFDDGQYASAVVLCASSSDFLSADGYAVTLMKGTSYNAVRLVKFAGGLSANSNITSIIGPSTPESSSSYTDYFSVKVIYSPATDKWQLFTRMDGTSVSVDPESGTLTQIGVETVDNTHTSKIMSNFGFFYNHGTATYYPTYFDNYKVVASPNVATGLRTGSLSKGIVKPIRGGFSITAENANVKIFDNTGKFVDQKQVNGIFNYETSAKGIYFIQISNKNGVDVVKQIVQ